jgi:hypothetical protein
MFPLLKNVRVLAGDIAMDTDPVAVDDRKIYDLTEVYEEKNGRNGQEVIVIDGRGYERIVKNNKDIHELVDVIEDQQAANIVNEEIIRQAAEIAERIARELIPGIAERVIREEIEKLKKSDGNGSAAIN